MAIKETKVSNFWGMLSFYCDRQTNDGKTCGTQLEITMQGDNPVCRCEACGFAVSFYEVEKAMRKVSDIIVQSAVDDEDVDMTNMKWIVGNAKTGIRNRYHILSHKNNKIAVGIAEVPH